MELIKSKNTKYDEYEELLLERDQVSREADQILRAYIRQFGSLITDGYREWLECVKRKETVVYYRNALNHGRAIDPQAMQKYLEREMAEYYSELREMLNDLENCRKARTNTAYEVQRSKTLYRRLARLIHPDIFPETDRNDCLRELWARIVDAYERSDVKALSELEVLVRKVLADFSSGEIQIDIPDIEAKIDELKAEIEEIMHTEPYIFKYFLEDEKASEEKERELVDELEHWQKYKEELDGDIEDLLQNGGVTIKWLTS